MKRVDLMRRLITALYALRRSNYSEAEQLLQRLYDDVSQINLFEPKDNVINE